MLESEGWASEASWIVETIRDPYVEMGEHYHGLCGWFTLFP